MQKLQQADNDVGSLLQTVEQQQKPHLDDCQGKSRTFQLLPQQLYVCDGLLFCHYEDTNGEEK